MGGKGRRTAGPAETSWHPLPLAHQHQAGPPAGSFMGGAVPPTW